ncbi:GHKL domain-containing protein [Pelagicoccus sp. NFK12]|uniref:histidine kinase n=1 Tax=Pelagicoccus enzymogenes TaxID=2773457 RepID=A0A927FA83_9BACT|nr:ATP-binding protein [Pelagicoccus enzymogenes]MBD5781237.1 GHKL domain-containing protein [Pelagicoccus enzymogenes]
MAILCLAAYLAPFPARAELPIETIEKWGAPHIERYVPKTTRIGSPVKRIAMLPDGDIAFLSENQFTVFDGTQWTDIHSLQRPGLLATLSSGQTIASSGSGLKRIEPNRYGHYDIQTLVSPQDHPERHALFPYIADARGYLFALQGTLLVTVAPDGDIRSYQLESWASALFSIGDEIYTTGGAPALINRWDWENETLVDAQQPLNDTEYLWFRDARTRSEGGAWLLNEQNRIIGFDGTKSWFWPGNATIAALGGSIQCFEEIAPGQLAIGTHAAGALVFDSKGILQQQTSKKHGLDSASVLGIGADNQDGLWISTKRSISRVQLSPSTLVYDERHGLTEAIVAAEVLNDRLYLATASGLYVNNPHANSMAESFVLKHPLSGINDILAYRGKLFVAGSNLSLVDENDELSVLSTEGSTNLWQPSADPDLVLAGNYRGILASRYSNGSWGAPRYLEGPHREIFGLAESSDGTLIGSTGGNDYAKVVLLGDNGRFELRQLPVDMQDVWSMVVEIEGEIYVNSSPTHRWNSDKDSFEPSPEMGYYQSEPPYGFDHIFGTSTEDTWISVNARRGKTVRRPNREVVGQISGMNDALEARASCIAYDSAGRAWIGGSFGLMLARYPTTEPDPLRASPQIHRLISLKDEAILPTIAESDASIRLKPKQNSLRIEAEFPHFLASSQNQFQIYIEGLDKSWPEPSTIPFREVTNLPPGRYTVILNARNTFGQSASSALPLFVETPLYLRPIAFVAYFLGALLAVAAIVYLYNRQQIRRSRQLQKMVAERTKEIANKNDELEAQALRLEVQNEELEEKTEELTATTEALTNTLNQLHQMQDQLVATARTAGKAEIAINVLHNVGNVLNSLNVSVNVLSQRAQESHATKLTRLAALVEAHRESIADFIANDPRGKNVPNYLIQLSKTLEEEIAKNLHELGVMSDDIDHIKSVIAAQQTHARSESVVETVRLRELCVTALNIVGTERSKTQVEVINEVPPDIAIENDKHRLLDIALNLISNAYDAIDEQAPEIGVITLKAHSSGETVAFTVQDNGVGIAPENKEKLFRHGFTTKRDGHGFGLHSSANAAKTLGGSLSLESPGKGRGATATLTLPISFPTPAKSQNAPAEAKAQP